ncbi:MAG: ScyD/ScyE family protein, partial [Anaerolinea sp.]|nr:ScyD/ScyE family protein [Anaerolinea sp.]
NPVPTSIAFDSEGNAYVGFLTGFPFPEGGARIEKWSAAGELIETYSGLTAVVDLVWHEGEIYAVQFATFGDQGWAPDTGSVVRVTSDSVETLMDGLNRPYGLTLTPDAGLAVVVNSAYMAEAGMGMVIPVTMGGM